MRSILAISALTILWTVCTPLSSTAEGAEPVKFGVPRGARGGDTIENAQKNALKNAEENQRGDARNKLTSFKGRSRVRRKAPSDEGLRPLEADIQLENQARSSNGYIRSAPTATGGRDRPPRSCRGTALAHVSA